MHATARMQINLMLSKVEDIKQVVGLREMAFPLFWFEDVSCFIHEIRNFYDTDESHLLFRVSTNCQMM